MKLGGWIPLDKNLKKALPKDRPYTRLEAAFSLSCDYDCNNLITVAGYSKQWGWSRKKVSLFLNKMGVEITYPENIKIKQNQKGQIGYQIRNRSGADRVADREQIRMVDSKDSGTQKNRSGADRVADKEQIRNRSGSTTIYPISYILNPKSKKKNNTCGFSEEFEKWWSIYPKRKGRKVGKKDAAILFEKLPKKYIQELMTGTNNYSLECNGLPVDGHRFLRKRMWKDYLTSAQPDKPKLLPIDDVNSDEYIHPAMRPETKEEREEREAHNRKLCEGDENPAEDGSWLYQ